MGRLPADTLQALARQFTVRLVTVAQGCLLRAQAPQTIADAFIATRYGPHWGHLAGTGALNSASLSTIFARALP